MLRVGIFLAVPEIYINIGAAAEDVAADEIEENEDAPQMDLKKPIVNQRLLLVLPGDCTPLTVNRRSLSCSSMTIRHRRTAVPNV